MSRASARDRARPEPPRQLRRSARRLLARCCFTDRVRTRLVPWLVSYAVGALLGVALLALLPEALDAARAAGGVRHAARRHPAVLRAREAGAAAPLPHRRVRGARRRPRRCVFIGDAFHNFIDGAIICTAVLTSVPLGINTAIAVAAHEIPQEVGDVAILLAAGYSRGRALMLNVVSGASGIARRARRVRRGRGRARHPARTSSRSRPRACSTSRCRI